MEFCKHVLANGLEIVAETDGEAHSTALGFFVKTGARDEETPLAGVSHFLEHMCFKGSGTRTAEDVNREFDELGAHYNAFTSEEATVYYAAVLPEYLPRAFDLLADIVRPALREEDFVTEKQVIIEEIRMYEDQPPFGADEKCRALFFGSHPLGHSVLGTVQSITDLPVEAMRSYHERRYSPGNMVLAATGRLDFDELVALVEQRCSQWEPHAASRETPPARPAHGFHVLERKSATQQYALQLSAGPAAHDEDRYAAKLLTVVLGDESGSRLFWELVDPGRAEHAGLGHHDYQGAGLFMTYMACAPDDVAENLATIRELYLQAEADGVTPAELSQAKNKVNSRVVLASERPRGRLFNVGGNWAQRREYRTVKDDLDSIERLTCDDIAAVLRRYPLTENATVVIGPRSEVRAPGEGKG